MLALGVFFLSSVLSDLKLQPMFLRSQMVTLLPMSGIYRSARLYGSCSVN